MRQMTFNDLFEAIDQAYDQAQRDYEQQERDAIQEEADDCCECDDVPTLFELLYDKVLDDFTETERIPSVETMLSLYIAHEITCNEV